MDPLFVIVHFVTGFVISNVHLDFAKLMNNTTGYYTIQRNQDL